MKNTPFMIVMSVIFIINSELTLKLVKECKEVEALVNLISKLSISSDSEADKVALRQEWVSNTTLLQRLIYRIEYRRRLK